MSGHGTIGVVESDLVGLYYRSVLLGIHAVARENGVQCLTFHGSLQELQACQLAVSTVDGWIAVLPTEDIKDLAVSTHLLAEELDTMHQLTWLAQVGVRWGCLGQWIESDSDGLSALMVAGFYSRDTNTETLLGNREVRP